MHQTARMDCPSEDVKIEIYQPSEKQREFFEAGRRMGKSLAGQTAADARLGNAIYFADLVQFQEAYKRADEMMARGEGGGTTRDGERLTIPEAVRRSTLSVRRQGKRDINPREIVDIRGVTLPTAGMLEMLLDKFEAFDQAERTKLFGEFREMTAEQQWAIVDNADDMARLYRRQKDTDRAVKRAALYAQQQQAKRPAPAEPARVGDGKRRYFDE